MTDSPTPQVELLAIQQACEREGIPCSPDAHSDGPVLWQVFSLIARLTRADESLTLHREQLREAKVCCYALSARAIFLSPWGNSSRG